MLLKLLTFTLFIFQCYGTEEKPLVQTPLGVVRGYFKKSAEGKQFAAFEGIPFAKPPTGNRRFEPPEPAQPWNGIWEATFLTECAQTGIGLPNITQGNENCLHINVYVPRQHPNPQDNLDVVVHVHGGGYMFGSGHLYANPDYIIDKDVIFVTFNYRVGILGFLSTEDEVLPGNNGMKDQVLALEWIQKNIASFGGNPNSVTLTGMSAGGSSVHLHYFSEMSRGLFHRGFSQSGVALNVWSLQKGALEKAKLLANGVGCPTSNTRVLVDCLKQRPYQHIVLNTKLFYKFGIIPIAPFAPVVEKGPKPFLRDHPFNLLTKGQVYDVPWILSTTKDEGFMLHLFEGVKQINLDKNWKSVAPFILDFNYTLDKPQWDSISETIKKFYYGENLISLENLEPFVRMYGDRTFLVDSEIAVRLHAKATKSPVYYYSFGYTGDDSPIKYVGHGFDSAYFYTSVFVPKPFTEDDHKMKNLLLNMLLSYVKTGTPVIDGVDWKPTGHDKLTFLNITGFNKEDIVLKSVDNLTPRQFWKSLHLLENENLFNFKDEL